MATELPLIITLILPLFLATWLSLSQIRSVVLGTSDTTESTFCRCFPGDTCWPSESDWAEFNRTVEGRLVATIPVASVCHDNPWVPYDAEACAHLQSVWDVPETHYETSSSPMAPFYANASCDPFTPRQAQCIIGAYVRYAVRATSARDYQLTLAFAKRNNIRLVIRNTGHDYMSKSTGAGAIALWTHHIRDIAIYDYSSSFYQGKVLKAGAGVMVYEAQAAADAQGLLVVTGDCPSVGYAGGYTQGAGHGSLASAYGLAADQVLEWEVVLTDGRLLTATPTQNTDLYWALSGGGGGTFGVVLSMTAKTYPNLSYAAVRMNFTATGSPDVFWKAVRTFLEVTMPTTEAGVGASWLLADGFFSLEHMIAPGMTSEQLNAFLQPTLAELDRSGIPYNYASGDYTSYLAAQEALFPAYNVVEYTLGGYFIPRSLFANGSIEAITDALRFLVDHGAAVSGMPLDVSRKPAVPNSVNPAWRTTAIVLVYGLPYDPLNMTNNLEAQRQVTEVLTPRVEALAPGAGAYLNEGDLHQPNWQQTFYGQSYAKLLSIKRQYDPEGILFAPTAVGSEDWQIEADGRLCKS
ncbi:hypothetical protein F4778DRAFT_232684 [Xylariomycetidae sp. FL2044]|nr:hypothetical protein F4778DRAFT_232684 [Xylariomycetidae sp. FL2044]